MKPMARRPSPAMVVAVVALVVALGGSAYAAFKLPKNSVGTPQLKNGAVTSTKVKNRSLLAADFAEGQLTPGPKGDPGPKGNPGERGVEGNTGPKGPAGSVAMLARMDAIPQTSVQEVTYGSPSGTSTASTSESSVSMLSPDVALTASNLAVKLTVEVNPNSARRFTLEVDGAETALSCTMGSFGKSCTSAESVEVPPLSLLSIKSDRPASFNTAETEALIAFQLTQ